MNLKKLYSNKFRMNICSSSFLVFLTCIFILNNAFSQSVNEVSNDCNKLKIISLNSELIYGYTSTPDYNNTNSFLPKNAIKDKRWFEKEHYCVWYGLEIKKEGLLEFDIIPESIEQDNDFLLFKVDSFNVCEFILKRKLVPIRSNISRNNRSIDSKTGLSINSKFEFNNHGNNASYSKFVNVKPGEKYILVVDNVSKKVKGHKIVFKIGFLVNLKGSVITEGLNSKADISITDLKGNEILSFKTNKNGFFDTTAFLHKNQTYNLIVLSDSSSVETKTFTVKNSEPIKFELVLKKLKRGNKYKFDKILFKPESDEFLVESNVSLESLFKLLKKNKKLKIHIEGHVNSLTEDAHTLDISFKRAKAVNDYLVKRGIDKSRLTYEGKGCKELIYKDISNEEVAKFNRRIEIIVIDY